MKGFQSFLVALSSIPLVVMANNTSPPNDLPPTPNYEQLTPVYDCVLIAVMHTNHHDIVCMRPGGKSRTSWEHTKWEPSQQSKKTLPESVWPACSWLNNFGFDEIIKTASLGHDRSMGKITRAQTTFEYHFGHHISGGKATIIIEGKYCPGYNSEPVAPKPKDTSLLDLFSF